VTGSVSGRLIDGRYRVGREIARGGMAIVYEAEHVPLNRRVALKMMAPEIALLPVARARLLLEAQALEVCRGPHVVRVLDTGIDRNAPFLVLEMLDGKSLDAVIAARGRLSVHTTVSVGLEILAGLACVHAAGVVHRDIKPANVLITRDERGVERVKLIDFGVAQVAHEAASPKLTFAGERVGTLEYMAPEQLLAEDVDARADVFAVGATLFECIAGDVPFPGGPSELLHMALDGKCAPSLSRFADVPPALAAVIAASLSRDRARRPQSAIAMARALRDATGIHAAPLEILESPRSADSAQERKCARAPYVAPIRVIDGSGALDDGHIVDLSETGLMAVLAAPLATDETVTLRFCLPMSGRVVTVHGTVRWTAPARNRHVAGLAVHGLTPEAREEVSRFVALSNGARDGRAERPTASGSRRIDGSSAIKRARAVG